LSLRADTRYSQQIFCRGIHVANQEVRVKQNNGGVQIFDALGKAALFPAGFGRPSGLG